MAHVASSPARASWADVGIDMEHPAGTVLGFLPLPRVQAGGTANYTERGMP